MLRQSWVKFKAEICLYARASIPARGQDVCAIAVHAAARFMAQSQSSEVLVSRVTDLVVGAGLKFTERGSYELKDLPGRWDLFAASA